MMTVLIACLCAIVVTLGAVFYGMERVTGDALGSLKFLKTLVLVREKFVEQPNDGKLFDGAATGLVKALDDPYSVYLDQQNFKDISNVTEGFFGGIGVVVGKKDNNFVVVAPLEGTPGEKAGIKAGEKIVQVDGKKTAGMQLEDVVAMIRGTQGTEVELVLDDNKGNERTVRVVRGDIKIKSVAGEMLPDSKIGYIRIAIFNENTSGEFVRKYQELEEQGMQSLLLDLRQNPGGILGESVRVAQYLVPKGPIVSVIDREGRKYTEESYLEKVKYPLAVLVDHGSASASEIVAGAVQDTKSGKLFGTQTFGKGSVQTVYRLPQNTGLKLTTAKYYTPSGRSINGTGITPDEVVELPEQATRDIQLETAENYLRNLKK
ncbi:S41 family peptidase [uncultured Phascolarctobacterium sp.]|nr:S41 family peptidase [uncultured Phascolarctobacterium sp.]